MTDDYTDLVKWLREKAKRDSMTGMENPEDHIDWMSAAAIEAQAARIAELEKIIDVMYADGDKNDARVMRYKAIASKAIREQVAIREDYEAVISELKLALRPFIEEYEGWSENDYKYVPANVLRARSALARVKDSK